MFAVVVVVVVLFCFVVVCVEEDLIHFTSTELERGYDFVH